MVKVTAVPPPPQRGEPQNASIEPPPPSEPSTPMFSQTARVVLGGAVVAGAIGYYAFSRFHVASPSEYIVKTGFFIDDIIVAKKTIQWPLQTAVPLSMVPFNISFTLHAMSSEKMEFMLPGVFTIAPKDDVNDLKLYARRLLHLSEEDRSELINGIIEGETRVAAARLTMEEIFASRDQFRRSITDSVQEEIEKFGLQVQNANIKELEDMKGSEYFKHLRQRTLQSAMNMARVDTAAANQRGIVGEKAKEAETRRESSKIEAETVVYENMRIREMEESKATLAQQKFAFDQATKIAEVESKIASQIREVDLTKELEERKSLQATAQARATLLSKAQVDAEVALAKAEGEGKSMERLASAQKAVKQTTAEARLFEEQRLAEGHLYNEQKKAEGVLASLSAQAAGMKSLAAAFGNDNDHLLKYIMVDRQVYQSLADSNAKAIKDLNPKINVWTTGTAGGGSDSDPYKAIRDLGMTLPPLLKGIEDQVGLTLPSWLVVNKESASGTADSPSSPVSPSPPPKVIEGNVKKPSSASSKV